jgi:hypothetical protein
MKGDKMKKLISDTDITIVLYQTGEKFVLKQGEEIQVYGLTAERLMKQSNGVIHYEEEKTVLYDLVSIETQLNQMSIEEIKNSDYRNLLNDEMLDNEKITKKNLIKSLLEVMKERNENQV